MRLEKLNLRGHTVKHKMILGAIRLASGHRGPDVIRTLFYREGFFGKHHNILTQAVMRGVSAWTVGERELFAAFVSRLNRCPF